MLIGMPLLCFRTHLALYFRKIRFKSTTNVRSAGTFFLFPSLASALGACSGLKATASSRCRYTSWFAELLWPHTGLHKERPGDMMYNLNLILLRSVLPNQHSKPRRRLTEGLPWRSCQRYSRTQTPRHSSLESNKLGPPLQPP